MVLRSPGQLTHLLNEQIHFIENSCAAFDAGSDEEAKRLAVAARVLLHDTGTSTSLLQQIGLKGVPFLSSAPGWKPNNAMPYLGLVIISMEDGSFKAPLGNRRPDSYRWLSFNNWWNEIVFDDKLGNQLTRKDLILDLANKEGGAHVDNKLTPRFEAIANKTFWKITTEEGEFPLEREKLQMAMRQIAYELLRTLEQIGKTP